MNWNELLLYVLEGIAGIAITVVSSFLIPFLISKVKNEKLAKILTSLNEIVTRCVKEVQQTYVDSLKKSGKFDEAAQKEAMARCLDYVKSELTDELKTWITTNKGDIDTYLKSLIESLVYSIKLKEVA